MGTYLYEAAAAQTWWDFSVLSDTLSSFSSFGSMMFWLSCMSSQLIDWKSADAESRQPFNYLWNLKLSFENTSTYCVMRHAVTQAQKPWYRPLPKMTVSYPLNTLLTEGRMITPLHHHKNHLCLKATALVVIILQTAHNEAQLALVQLASTESLDHLLLYRMHSCVVLLRVHG